MDKRFLEDCTGNKVSFYDAGGIPLDVEKDLVLLSGNSVFAFAIAKYNPLPGIVVMFVGDDGVYRAVADFHLDHLMGISALSYLATRNIFDREDKP